MVCSVAARHHRSARAGVAVVASRRERFTVLETVNPIVPKDTVVVESDTGRVKVGDGFKRYNELSYQSEAAPVNPADILPGKELGYAEVLDGTFTTTQTADTDSALMGTRIPGLISVVQGANTWADVEVYIPLVTHTVVQGTVYAVIMMNGVRIATTPVVIAKANVGQGPAIVKKRVWLAAGTEYTFESSMTIDTAGTATYYAGQVAKMAMHLSVVAR